MTPQRALFVLVALGLSFGSLSSLQAQSVSPRTGNLSMTFTDVTYGGERALKVERVYNSKSGFKGIFGMAWGSELEVYLRVLHDGAVVIYEWGGGAENRFEPPDLDTEELEAAVATIAAAARAAATPAYLADPRAYRERLLSDARYRGAQWAALVQSGRLAPRALAMGTRLSSRRFNYQYVQRHGAGYDRHFQDGKIERFNVAGKLVAIVHPDDYRIAFDYDAHGQLETMHDSLGRALRFAFNDDGFVTRIDGEDGRSAEYTYGPGGRLITSRDTSATVHRFEYDAIYNLLAIGYADATTVELRYLPRALNDSVQSVRSREGKTRTLEYNWERVDAQDRRVMSVKRTDAAGVLETQGSYVFYLSTRASGEQWIQRLVETINAQSVDTVYGEQHGRPLTIDADGYRLSFDYDAQGHVIEKRSPTQRTRLSYGAFGRLSAIVAEDLATGEELWHTRFEHDALGNQTGAADSKGRAVSVRYDEIRRLAQVTWTDGEVEQALRFNYNCAICISDTAEADRSRWPVNPE
ncbi:MAG: RHS repeat protein [Bradymonadaceae bacterium]|nr:RHS repeat protein [Lujinxingiaceae bacterium]